PRRRPHHRLAAGIRKGGAPRDGAAAPAGAGTSRATGTEVMRPFASTISIDEARRRLAANVRPIDPIERIPLADAPRGVAAADIISSIAVPPFARSAMDGYAVVAADVRSASRQSPVRLRIVDRIFTGETSRQTIAPRTCAEIATGAPLPAGADAVVMVE